MRSWRRPIRAIFLIATMLVLSPVGPLYADLPKDCRTEFKLLHYLSTRGNISADTSFEDLALLHARLPAQTRTVETRDNLTARVLAVRQNIDRLVEPQFDSSPSGLGKYGMFLPPPRDAIEPMALVKSHGDWIRGLRYIQTNAENRTVSFDLLADLHRMACENMFFYGFEGRRILQRYKSGAITEPQLREQLGRAYKKNENLSGMNHKTLVGQIRSDATDQLSHHGSQRGPAGDRFFSQSEFQSFSQNPFMTLVPNSIQRLPDGRLKAEFRYLDATKVKAAAENAINTANETIASATTLEMKVGAIVRMQKDLLSIHPFLDGNGRTVKLLADLMYQRAGLPHPARPNERDLEMSVEEATEFVRQQMINTVNRSEREGAR